jgi:hypothetical protein
MSFQIELNLTAAEQSNSALKIKLTDPIISIRFTTNKEKEKLSVIYYFLSALRSFVYIYTKSRENSRNFLTVSRDSGSTSSTLSSQIRLHTIHR